MHMAPDYCRKKSFELFENIIKIAIFFNIFCGISFTEISFTKKKFSLTEIYSYLEREKKSPYQAGFRAKRSTTTPLVEFHVFIVDSLAQSISVDVVFLAFDSVDHKMLSHSVESNRMPSQSINWLSNYLSERTQSVCFEDSFSNLISVISVPQWSSLGPLLLYINYVNILYLRTFFYFSTLMTLK